MPAMQFGKNFLRVDALLRPEHTEVIEKISTFSNDFRPGFTQCGNHGFHRFFPDLLRDFIAAFVIKSFMASVTNVNRARRLISRMGS